MFGLCSAEDTDFADYIYDGLVNILKLDVRCFEMRLSAKLKASDVQKVRMQDLDTRRSKYRCAYRLQVICSTRSSTVYIAVCAHV